MTEQEKRKEEIYKKYRGEMSEDLMDSMPIELKDRAFGDEIWLANKIVRMCHSMIDKGYRKADEVRKEMAKEYSKRIDEIVTWCISNETGDDFDYEYFLSCIRNLKKEFGVEVEE